MISKGVKYNNTFVGGYFVIGKEPKIDIEHIEKEIDESTEKLSEIINTYMKYDQITTSLSVWLSYSNEITIPFTIYLSQDKVNKSLITFETNVHHTPNEQAFLQFLNLCKDIFIAFNFVYGSYRSQDEGFIPSHEEEFLKEPPNIVNFYSKSIVSKIGRKKLLLSPAYKVEELSNDGIMLLLCTNPLGCYDAYWNVREYLGYF